MIRVTLLAIALVSFGASADDALEEAAAGKAVYSQTCIACHGADGKGTIPGVSDLTRAQGALAKSDAALIKNITDGFQSPGAALAMPAKGGNPALTEADIKAVLVYLRSAFGT